MINWHKPLRLKKSERQVYVVGRADDGSGRRMVGPTNRWGSGGIWYELNGQPVETCPWGAVENYDPLEDLGMDGWHEVANPAERRAQRQLVQESEDNPLFGAWS